MKKHIEQNVHSVAGVMPKGLELGVLDGLNTLAWGFAMAPHRLRILVLLAFRWVLLCAATRCVSHLGT